MLQPTEMSPWFGKAGPSSSRSLLSAFLGKHGASSKCRGVFLPDMSETHCGGVLAAAVGVC